MSVKTSRARADDCILHFIGSSSSNVASGSTRGTVVVDQKNHRLMEVVEGRTEPELETALEHIGFYRIRSLEQATRIGGEQNKKAG